MGPPPFLSQANVLTALLNKSLAPAKLPDLPGFWQLLPGHNTMVGGVVHD